MRTPALVPAVAVLMAAGCTRSDPGRVFPAPIQFGLRRMPGAAGPVKLRSQLRHGRVRGLLRRLRHLDHAPSVRCAETDGDRCALETPIRSKLVIGVLLPNGSVRQIQVG